ncbi:AtpZ/AtpI family protein [Polyangium mundeleinium]|uniref:AtpZ/AtpI family protein n=1 Tax=Polyangium mundeleinium TaxID=2995306 RepID=A0ABT5F6X4_9BACT|nr:AtpZ/AtpI family protein [Polyangium mundeleinium]MDC0749133.1 AtpZ/AtpI family protein [Polyangium mundeleinium]
MNGKERKRPPKVEEWRGVGSLGTIGLEVVLSIAFGYFGGRWLDGKFGTEPYLAVLGFCFGIGAAVRAFQRALREMKAQAEREEREQGNPLPRYDAPDERKDEAPITSASDEDTNVAKDDEGASDGESDGRRGG